VGTTPDRQYGRELATEPEVAARIASHTDGTLLHDVDRAAGLTIVRDGAGRIQLIRYRDGEDGPAVRETEVTRDANGRASTITDRQFEPPGTLARTRVLTLARDASGKVSGGSVVVT
jgi:hypothetical protein